MSDGSNYLDPDRPEAVRLSVGNARALGEAALVRIGYGADDACIITDQLIDNALCGYRFAGCPHPRGRATRRPGTPASQSPSYTRTTRLRLRRYGPDDPRKSRTANDAHKYRLALSRKLIRLYDLGELPLGLMREIERLLQQPDPPKAGAY